MKQLAAKILSEFNKTELWDIDFSRLVNIIIQTLEAEQYAVYVKNKNRYHLFLNHGYKKTVSYNDVKRSHISLKFRIENLDYQLHIKLKGHTTIKENDRHLIQNAIDLISKILAMRQISKNRILETQIINELNLNVITSLNERKIIGTLEKSARKMLNNERIWLYYLIEDSLIGSQTQFKIKHIPATIYFKLFRGQQIFTSTNRIKILKQLCDNDDIAKVMTFIPFSIKNHFRGFFVVGDDILNKRKSFDITRLRFLANQAALAIERIDLFQTLNRALRESHGIQELIKIMISTLDIETLFNEILQRAQKILGFGRILFSMYEPSTNTFRRVTGVGIPSSVLNKAKKTNPPFETINALFHNRYRILNSFYIPAGSDDLNLKALKKYQLFSSPNIKKKYNEVWDSGDIFISPIYNKDRELVAILSLDQPSTNLAPHIEKVKLLETFGDFLGMAIENAQLFSKIENLSNTDELTGVHNYRFLRETVADLINKGNKNITLTMIDLDNFKEYNDQYGHLRGDQILKLFSQLLVKIVNQRGYIVRYGGDEFIILLPAGNRVTANKIVKEVNHQLSKTQVEEFHGLKFSSGTACYPKNGDELGGLIDHADNLVYSEKLNKRDGIKT